MTCTHELTILFDPARVPESVRDLARLDVILGHKADYRRCVNCGRIGHIDHVDWPGQLTWLDKHCQAKREKDAAAWYAHWEKLAGKGATHVPPS